MSKLINVSDVQTLEEYAAEYGCTLKDVLVGRVKDGPLFVVLSKDNGRTIEARSALSKSLQEKTQREGYLNPENLYQGICEYDNGDAVPTVFYMGPKAPKRRERT